MENHTKPEVKICAVCGQEFQPRNPRSTVCGQECKMEKARRAAREWARAQAQRKQEATPVESEPEKKTTAIDLALDEAKKAGFTPDQYGKYKTLKTLEGVPKIDTSVTKEPVRYTTGLYQYEEVEEPEATLPESDDLVAKAQQVSEDIEKLLTNEATPAPKEPTPEQTLFKEIQGKVHSEVYEKPTPWMKDTGIKTPDPVNHPSHYTRGKIEVIDYIDEYFKENYYLGQVCKYISRAGHKANELEDLKKAKWYLDRYVEQMEGKNGLER